MNKPIRIGTRESALALWQARQVLERLAQKGIAAELVPVSSEGDQDLVTPLYSFGVQGVFTRTLDAHLLSKRIDIAVHSMKDVPVELPKGITQLAVLKRGDWQDILVLNERHAGKDWAELSRDPLVIATSSIRRRAQWLHRFPTHEMADLRGNVATRLRKIGEQGWDGAIFARAGLSRIGLLPPHAFDLEWMLPAPAQGAIMVVRRTEDNETARIGEWLNDRNTAMCVKVERDFLRALLGGCATPISGHATVQHDKVHFHGNVYSPDGKEHASVEIDEKAVYSHDLGKQAADLLIANGADRILNKLRQDG